MSASCTAEDERIKELFITPHFGINHVNLYFWSTCPLFHWSTVGGSNVRTNLTHNPPRTQGGKLDLFFAQEMWMSSKQPQHQIYTQRRRSTSRSSSFSDSFGSVQREFSRIWVRFPFYGVCYTSVSPIIHYITRDKCIYIKTSSSSSSVILRLD